MVPALSRKMKQLISRPLSITILRPCLTLTHTMVTFQQPPKPHDLAVITLRPSTAFSLCSLVDAATCTTPSYHYAAESSCRSSTQPILDSRGLVSIHTSSATLHCKNQSTLMQVLFSDFNRVANVHRRLRRIVWRETRSCPEACA